MPRARRQRPPLPRSGTSPALASRLGITLLAGLLPMGFAHALALGEIVSQSPLGAPLAVDIQVLAGDAKEAKECLRLRSDGAEDGLPVIEQGKIEAAPGSGNWVRISSSQPVTEPIIRLQLENICQSRLRRDYVLLVPFPTQIQPPRTISAPRVAQPSAQGSSATGSATPPPRPSAAPQAKHDEGERWTMAAGESVQSLARALFPDDTGARARFIASTLRANPEILPDADATSRALPAGTEIRIPDLRKLGSGAPRSTQPPPRSEEPAPRASGKSASSGNGQRATEQDRLVIAKGQGDPGSTAPRPGASPEQQTKAQESRLMDALDEQMVRQMELSERIRQLEAMQASLLKQIEQAVSPPLPPSTAPAPPPPAPEAIPARNAPPPAREQSSWLWILLATVAGGLIAVGVKALFDRFQERRAARTTEEFERGFTEQFTKGWPTTMPTPASAPVTGSTAEGEAPPAIIPPAAVTLESFGTRHDREDTGFQFPAVPEEEDTVEEHDSAVELAEIMMSFGRLHGAAETLAEFIRSNPKQSVTPWLKLLDVYHAADMRDEFGGLAQQLNKTFNVQVVTWDNYESIRSSRESLEAMPHIVARLQQHWNTRECQAYLHDLIRDNRDGTRLGFPLPVVDDLLVLAGILEQHLGVYRPSGAIEFS